MKTLILLLIGALCLSACATHSIAPGQLSPFERRSITAVNNDREIETDIYDELQDDAELFDRTHITVTAFNGTVLLTGEAATEPLRDKIVHIAQLTDNVKRVHNNIAIAYPSGIDTRQRDLQITADVIAALKEIHSIPDFDASQVKVVAENANVYLMGLLHRQEGVVVINVIRHVPDIKQIITVFEYLE